MKLPLLGIHIDERFLMHRLRSTSWAGMAAAAVAGGLAIYRLLHDHRTEWDLFAVLGAMVLVKFSVLAWYRYTD
jgi:hypothetical protein